MSQLAPGGEGGYSHSVLIQEIRQFVFTLLSFHRFLSA